MPKQSFVNFKLAGAAALLLATSPAAWADLAAPTLWADWQEVYNRFGGTLAATSEDYSGGTLTLEGVNYTTEFAGATSTANYGTIIMAEQGDGSVNILIPAEVSTDTVTQNEGVVVNQALSMRHENLSIVAREDGGERVYDLAADTMTFDVDTVIEAPGQSTDPTTVTIRLAGMESIYRSGLGADGEGFAQTFALDGMDIASVFSDGDEGGEFSYALTGIASDFEGSYGPPPTGPVVGLSDLNITYNGTMTHSGSTMAVVGQTPDGALNIAGTSQSGTLALEMGSDALTYSLASLGSEITAQVPGFPLPVNVSMAELSSAFTLPMGASDEAKPIGLQVALRDLVVDDMLWGLFDPTGQLPRDPATLLIDMDGTAVMNVDIFGDPEAMAALAGAPGALKTMTLNQLLLNIAGAELRGEGDLDFPTESIIPEPVGTINLALDGGFALVDKIVALGFIPAEQAAFVKGMAGAVTRPVGDDQLESTIEFTPGGGISANGLPLK